MDTGHRVVDALSLAVNRLDEPSVRDHYCQLIELVDAHLGGQLLGDGAVRPLTEPQLVLISYGLKHLRGPNAAPLVRASGRLESALNGTLETSHEASGTPQPEQAPVPASEPPSRPLIASIKQRIDRAGSAVTMIEQQSRGDMPPPAQSGAGDEDGGDTSEMRPVDDAVPRTSTDVFISYSRRNAEIMRRIRADLRASGLSVWTDDNLTPGKPSWQRAVHAAIRGARTMIVIMTPDSKASEWVEHEISSARVVGVPVFPVLARGSAKNAIPTALKNHPHVDISKEADYRQALHKLTRALKQETKRRERQG